MSIVSLLGFIYILIYLGIAVFAIYVVITVIKLMKERNNYLKDIREELKKNNNKS